LHIYKQKEKYKIVQKGMRLLQGSIAFFCFCFLYRPVLG
jgi:hypothetical protein